MLHEIYVLNLDGKQKNTNRMVQTRKLAILLQQYYNEYVELNLAFFYNIYIRAIIFKYKLQ